LGSGELGFLSILNCLLFLVKRLLWLNRCLSIGCLVVLNANVAFFVPEAIVFGVLRVVPVLNILWLSVLILRNLEGNLCLQLVNGFIVSLDLLILSISGINQLLVVLNTFLWHCLLLFSLLQINSRDGRENLKNSVVVNQNVLLILEHEVETKALMALGVLKSSSKLS